MYKNLKYLLLLSVILSGAIAKEMNINNDYINEIYKEHSELCTFIKNYIKIIEYGKKSDDKTRREISLELIKNKDSIIKTSEKLLIKELNKVYVGLDQNKRITQYSFPTVLNQIKNQLDSLELDNNYDKFFNEADDFNKSTEEIDTIIEKINHTEIQKDLPSFNIVEKENLNIVLHYLINNNYYSKIIVDFFSKNILFKIHENYYYDYFWKPIQTGILLGAIVKYNKNLYDNFIKQMQTLNTTLRSIQYKDHKFYYLKSEEDPKSYSNEVYLKYIALEETNKLLNNNLSNAEFAKQYILIIKKLINSERKIKINISSCILHEIAKKLDISD